MNKKILIGLFLFSFIIPMMIVSQIIEQNLFQYQTLVLSEFGEVTPIWLQIREKVENGMGNEKYKD